MARSEAVVTEQNHSHEGKHEKDVRHELVEYLKLFMRVTRDEGDEVPLCGEREDEREAAN